MCGESVWTSPQQPYHNICQKTLHKKTTPHLPPSQNKTNLIRTFLPSKYETAKKILLCSFLDIQNMESLFFSWKWKKHNPSSSNPPYPYKALQFWPKWFLFSYSQLHMYLKDKFMAKNSTLSIHQKINVFCDLNNMYLFIHFRCRKTRFARSIICGCVSTNFYCWE